MVVVRFPKNVVERPKVERGGLLAVLALLGFAAAVLYWIKKLSARG
jgi:hypothetical protein